MPVLLVYGMPNLSQLVLEQLILDLRTKVASVEELALTIEDVSVFFQVDRVEKDLGIELICFVEGLFTKPERTPEVRQKLADTIRDVLKAFALECISECEKVEVLVKKFDQDKDGFAQATMG